MASYSVKRSLLVKTMFISCFESHTERTKLSDILLLAYEAITWHSTLKMLRWIDHPVRDCKNDLKTSILK